MASNSVSKITLQCVRDKSKLRIKFHSFTDMDGKIYTNVYDNTLNCKFPKDIRQEGYFYEIPSDNLLLVNKRNTKPYYNIHRHGIRIIPVIDFSTFQIFEINECVICMDQPSNVTLVPCGHRCICSGCFAHYKKKCAICRREIVMVVDENSNARGNVDSE